MDSTHHSSRIDLGADVVVNSVWFDKSDSTDDASIMTAELQSISGVYPNKVFVSTQIRMTIAQARELHKALGVAIIAQDNLIEGDYDLLTRKALGLYAQEDVA